MRNLELGAFLKTRRARLRPEDVGVPEAGRRRVPGLRRAEVAALAGVSKDYYQRVEQGRAKNVSGSVLLALARALRLNDVEREHLFVIAARTGPVGLRLPETLVRPGVRALVDSFGNVPVLLLGNRLDVLDANREACALLIDFNSLPSRERNFARFVFLTEVARERYVEWDTVAVETVGWLRWHAHRSPQDPALHELVTELSEASARFRKCWDRHEVLRRAYGVKQLRHPAFGRLSVRFECLAVPGDPSQMFCVYPAERGSPAAAAFRALTSTTALRSEGHT